MIPLPDKALAEFRYNAPVAQLDRVLGYEPSGQRFESSRARHLFCIKFLFYKDLLLNLTQLGYHLQYHFDNVGVSLEVRI